jgi:hypothetical protein
MQVPSLTDDTAPFPPLPVAGQRARDLYPRLRVGLPISVSVIGPPAAGLAGWMGLGLLCLVAQAHARPGASPSRNGHSLFGLCADAPVPPPSPRALCLLNCRIVYVESIARVQRLSLSGRILHLTRTADKLFVQWPEMAARFPGTTYAGRLY